MENKAHALAAGIFAIVFIAITVVALLWFGGKREEMREYVVVTRNNVTGLNPQAQVRYRGIRVGKVLDIDLDRKNPRNILIRIEIEADVPVTRSTQAKLGYQGVTGLAHVLLEDNGKDETPLVSGNDEEPPRIAMVPSLIEQLSESGGSALKEARAFLINANALLDENNRQRLGHILANLESGTARLNGLLADERIGKLGSAIARVDRAADSADKFFRDSKQLLPQAKAALGRVETLAGDEGAGATLRRVEDLTRDLSQTSRQLTRVLRVLEEAPESVVFGSPAPPPGPGEPGFVAPPETKEKQ